MDAGCYREIGQINDSFFSTLSDNGSGNGKQVVVRHGFAFVAQVFHAVHNL